MRRFRRALRLRPPRSDAAGHDHPLRATGRRGSYRLRRHHRRLYPRSAERMNTLDLVTAVPVCHVIKGATLVGAGVEYGPAHARFATPGLDLDALVWPRNEPGPAFHVPVAEIMDVLVATGRWLTDDPHGLLAEALEFSVR